MLNLAGRVLGVHLHAMHCILLLRKLSALLVVRRSPALQHAILFTTCFSALGLLANRESTSNRPDEAWTCRQNSTPEVKTHRADALSHTFLQKGIAASLLSELRYLSETKCSGDVRSN